MNRQNLKEKLIVFCAPLVMLALFVGISSHSVQAAPTAAECQQAWNNAPARAWCWFEDASVTDSGQCKLQLGCGTGSDRPTVTYTGTIANVKKLRWCTARGGYLTTGNC